MMNAFTDSALACEKCGLCLHRNNVVLPTACEPGGLLAVGEGPGEDEDLAGEGFIGSAGQRLDDLLRAAHFFRGREYGVANIVRCRPPENRRPKADEIRACIPLLADAIASIRPRVLLLVGDTAARQILGKATLEDKIAAARQNPRCDFSAAHPVFAKRLRSIDAELYSKGIVAIPMPHTSGLAWNRRSKKGEKWSVIGRQQVRLACTLAGGSPPESLERGETTHQGTLDF